MSEFDALTAHGDPAITLLPGPDAHIRAKPDVARHLIISWKGTARGGPVLRSQPPKGKAAIRQAICDAVLDRFGSDAPWNLPVRAAMVSGAA